ncbi:hypothetical protein OAG71_01100 [bacterium]|nr:hypothetical protein [bacterium]
MKTVNEISVLADKAIVDAFQGSIVSLKRSNNTSKGMMTTYTVNDNTGAPIDVSISGAQYGNIAPGSLITVKSTPNGKGGVGGVVVNEYKGFKSLTCWDNASVQTGGADTFPAEHEPAQQAAVAQQPAPAQPAQPAQSFSTSMNIEEMSDIWVRARQSYRYKLEQAGVTGDALERAADHAPQLVSLFWFGKDRNKLVDL